MWLKLIYYFMYTSQHSQGTQDHAYLFVCTMQNYGSHILLDHHLHTIYCQDPFSILSKGLGTLQPIYLVHGLQDIDNHWDLYTKVVLRNHRPQSGLTTFLNSFNHYDYTSHNRILFSWSPGNNIHVFVNYKL